MYINDDDGTTQLTHYKLRITSSIVHGGTSAFSHGKVLFDGIF